MASYDATKKGFPISWFSSEGPTRDGRKKPEIAAPGSNILAANSTTKKERILMSGTSMAAPAVTGSIALVFAAAAARNKSLTIDQLRDIITKKGRITPPEKVWDPRFGFGRIFVPDLIGLIPTAVSGANKVSKAFEAEPPELINKQHKKPLLKKPKKVTHKKRKAALSILTGRAIKILDQLYMVQDFLRILQYGEAQTWQVENNGKGFSSKQCQS